MEAILIVFIFVCIGISSFFFGYYFNELKKFKESFIKAKKEQKLENELKKLPELKYRDS